MKKGKTKSFTKLKLVEIKKFSKPASTTNINILNNDIDSCNNKQKELKTKGRYITNNEQAKSNIFNLKIKTQKNSKQNRNNSFEKEEIKLSKKAITTYENQLHSRGNKSPPQKENINNKNIINNNSNNILINEKILSKIQKLQEKYEKKIFKDEIEIKNLLERNEKLEELVIKLKETLDRANEMFPDFLEQLVNTKEEKERESNRTALSCVDKKNEEEKMKIEIKILKKKLSNYEQENNVLKDDNIKVKNEFNKKIENIIKEIEIKEKKKEEIFNKKIKEFNDELNTKNIEFENNQIQINKLKSDNQQNLFQITTLTEEIQQKNEEIKLLKIEINKEKDKNKNDLLLNDLKNELEELIVENNDLKNNLQKEKENSEKKLKNIQKDLDEKNNKLINLENSYKIISDELNNEKNENYKLKEDLENIINNKKEEIEIIKQKINIEINLKQEENCKLNEIINDQEKIINELKDIIHKNNDKILELTKTNNLLQKDLGNKNQELSHNIYINNLEIEQKRKELEEINKKLNEKEEELQSLQQDNSNLKLNIKEKEK